VLWAASPELLGTNPTVPLRPNIVFILADDLGYGDLSCQNPNSKIQTPRLDRLAGQGIRFTDAHAPSALCTPSRYGFLTGQNCWRTRLKSGVLNSWDEPLIGPERLTVAGLLRNNGYRTAMFGKWHLGLAWPFVGKVPQAFDSTVKPSDINWGDRIRGGPIDCGFDYYFGVNVPNEPPYVFIENDQVVAAPTVAYPTVRGQQGHWAGPGVAGWDWTQLLPQITAKTVSWIRQAAARSSQPFFLYASLVGPHQPVMPTKEFQGSSKAGVYGDYVQELDWAVGELLDALERTGAATNTLVIFSSDNGPDEFAYPRLLQYHHASMGQLRGVKSDIWEGGHRIPFLARWPGNISPGTTNTETICLIDFMRTVSDILNVPLPPEAAQDSVSFLPMLLAQARSRPAQRLLVLESGLGQFGIRSNNWMFIDSSTGDGHNPELEPIWFRNNRKYVSPTTQPALLYDLSSDLGERVNLLEQHSAVATELQTELTHQRASLTWSGSLSGEWANPNNWIPTAIPVGSDIVYTNLIGPGNFTQLLRGNYAINSMIVDPSVNADLLIQSANGGQLTIANGIDTAVADVNLSIAAPLALSQSQVWTVNEGHALRAQGSLALGSHDLTICGGGDTCFSNAIYGEGRLSLRNSGTNVLARRNYFRGGTELSGGGYLIASHEGALGSGGVSIPNNSTMVIAPGVTLTNTAVVRGFGAGSDGVFSGVFTVWRPGIASYNGPVVLLGDTGLRVPSSDCILNIGGCMKGDANFLVMNGEGTVVFSTNQLYTGKTLIEGRLRLAGGPDRLPTNTDLLMANSVWAELDLNDCNQSVRSLNGGAALGGNIVLGGATLTVAPNGTATYGGSVTGAGNLNKLGPGTLVLEGANSFAGQTTIGAGSLVINGHLAVAQVNAQGGTLSGSGSIAGPVTMCDGSLLDLSINPKPLSINNTLVLLPGSTTRVELDPARTSSGRVQGISVALYAGVLLITNISPASSFTNGQRFQLFGATLGQGNFSQIQPDPGPGLAWRFDAAKGTLIAVARPQLTVTTTGPKSATVAWSGQGFHLQVMTNSAGITGNGKWFDYPAGSTSPTRLLVDPSRAAIFFRLVSP
jgi:autotransporter-associated beta strand protein